MKRNTFFKKINETDSAIIDVDDSPKKDNKYIYYPSQKQMNKTDVVSEYVSSKDDASKDIVSKDIVSKDVASKDLAASKNLVASKDIASKDLVEPKSIFTRSQAQSIHLTSNKPYPKLSSNLVNKRIVKELKEEIIEKNIEKKCDVKVEMQVEEINSSKNEERLLFNLKIVSELNSADKLSFDKEQFSIDNPSYMQGVYRWWTGEDRAHTLEELNNIIDEAFEYMDKTFTNDIPTVGNSRKKERILYENNSQVMQKFYIALIDAAKGLDKLKSTYYTDKSMTTGLDLLMNKIRIRTDKIDGVLRIDPIAE